jgi:hypothetical protein
MALESLGFVTVASAGTPERATKNVGQTGSNLGPVGSPGNRFPCHSFLVEALPTNTGKVYVGKRSAMNKTTGAGLLAILPIPTTNLLPSFSSTMSKSFNAFDLSTIWIDVEVSGDGVLISAIIG